MTTLAFSCHEKERSVEKSDSRQNAVFERVSSSHSGITFNNKINERYETFFDVFAYVYNGGGVGIGDFNNDGLPDIYFTGNEVPNRLYLNEGNLKFKDISESAGVQGNGNWNNGVAIADVNADGWPDIYVCKGGWQESPEQRKNLLFINQGDLTFKEQAKEYGLDEAGYSIHASFFDMDNDNDLDLYITNRPDSFDLPLTQMVRQKILSPSSSRDKLYRNDNGKFVEIGAQAGITNNFGYALSLVTSDLNNDGYVDIFVANDFAEGDYMYINQKDGTFKEQIKEATNHISMYSMGTDVADINNDGWEDIMVSEMLPEDYRRSKVSMPSMDVEGFNAIVQAGMHKQYMHNVLHLNQGNLFFSDIAQFSGVAKTDWSWSCLLSDFDNDGNKDMFVANGYRRDVFDGDAQQKLTNYVRANRDKYSSPQEMFSKGFSEFIDVYAPIKVKNYLFKNNGDLRFENVTDAWGFLEESFSNGAAIADLDNDGDLDLVINNIDDEAFVYKNNSSGVNNYLRLKLEGPASNSDGIGARVTVFADGGIQYFENKVIRGYLSSNEPVVHFGLGKTPKVDSVRVVWPDGKINLLSNQSANQVLTVKHTEATIRKTQKQYQQLLAEATNQLVREPFVHRENQFNEYKEQILLPHMFSRSGPFIAKGDVNGDGAVDFYIGGAAGQAGKLYLQNSGNFVPKDVPAFESDRAFEDMGTLFFDADGDGDLDLYVVSGGSEFPHGSKQYADRLYVNDGKGNFADSRKIATISSGSCVVPYDIDGDGDLDLFRGGQVVANHYPKPARSYILINDGGVFSDKTSQFGPALAEVGMVNSAIWVDLDKDEKAELVVTGEWMPIKVFRIGDGKLTEDTETFNLNGTEGWWHKVIAEDIDGDGDIDLIAGNIGENYKFRASAEKPFQVFAKDFDGNGTNDIFLARYYKDDLLVPIRGRECTSQQMPVIAQKFPTFVSFAESDLSKILGKEIESALHYKAHMFSSVIFENDNGKFKQHRLPTESQLSAILGFVVKDFDGDGIKDILVGGNKFDVEVETTPADASPGILMKGLGNFQYQSLKSYESGLFIPYNVKDIQEIEVGNGHAILTTVNDGPMKAFHVIGVRKSAKEFAYNP